MEIYVKVTFWMGIASLVIRIIAMAIWSWPHTQQRTLGEYVGETAMGFAFVVWAGMVLWG